MPQKKCVPLTDDEMKYIDRAMRNDRTAHATELLKMKDMKHGAFTEKERIEIGFEVEHLEKQIKKIDAINDKIYCIRYK